MQARIRSTLAVLEVSCWGSRESLATACRAGVGRRRPGRFDATFGEQFLDVAVWTLLHKSNDQQISELVAGSGSTLTNTLGIDASPRVASLAAPAR